jgi:hypothetical protein
MNSNQLLLSLLPHLYNNVNCTAALCYEFYFYSFSGWVIDDVDNVADKTCKDDLRTEQWEEPKMTPRSALLYSSGKFKSCTREDFIIICFCNFLQDKNSNIDDKKQFWSEMDVDSKHNMRNYIW